MKDTTKFAGSAGGGRYQDAGVGNSESTNVDATIPGKFPSGNTGEGRSQGETSGAGSIYAAGLTERPNVSNTRNLGPDRAPSRSGSTAIPVANVGSRKTGKLG